MKTLRSQLSLSIMLVVLVTVVLISLLSNITVNRQFEEYITNQKQTRSEYIVHDLSSQYNTDTQTWDSNYLHTIGMYSLYDGYLLTVYDNSGTAIWDAESHDMTLCHQIMDEITERMSHRKSQGGFTAHTYDLTQNNERVGLVSVKYYGPYFYSENDFEFINTFNTVLIIIGIISCIFSLIVGWLLASRISRPIVKTAEIAEHIAEGNYNIRFEGNTKAKELSHLVSTINCLATDLEAQENLRKQLTTNVAHELRTPLTAIRSHLEAMIEGIWETTPERLTGCLEEVTRLSSLVADLERLAKVEGDNLNLKQSDMDILEAVKIIAGNFSAEAEKKGITLTIEGTPSIVYADKDRISQVITNLLSNAIKYTPEGGRVSLKVKDSETSGSLSVKDTGIGISKEDTALIFERFYRTDKSRNRKTGGAGIGLTIARSIVHAHGGSIFVESVENEGSVFTVVLPKSTKQ
ncbi:HAMP domain-containing sensor histidine kinase [Konateibacter massiliensis]|uniref:HAMP domain-containing sensor histidine kinase n=1 Tax=Konateibacter massiliensis TaxID=2002841 RepID=UPI000C160D8D|nr:HAMP domain-containing sensor histidine kinase [Konateibacter massiliensis]